MYTRTAMPRAMIVAGSGTRVLGKVFSVQSRVGEGAFAGEK